MGQGDKGILSMGVNYPGLHIGTPFPSPLADLTSASSTFKFCVKMKSYKMLSHFPKKKNTTHFQTLRYNNAKRKSATMQ